MQLCPPRHTAALDAAGHAFVFSHLNQRSSFSAALKEVKSQPREQIKLIS